MWRWIWWLPTVIVICFAFYFIVFGKGIGYEYNTVNIFLLLLGLCCITKIVFSLLSFVPKFGTWLGLVGSVLVVWIILWGITIGFSRLRIRNVVYASPDVPEAFNGYRIVQISDIHAGTFSGPYKRLLRQSIDTINALHPDLICFVGDLENFTPAELLPHKDILSALHAKDGVVSIMGNHDYSSYINISDRQRAAMVCETQRLQRSFGWKLLNNNYRIIRRAKTFHSGDTDVDSIIVVGEENWGKPPFPQYGRLDKALSGLSVKHKRIQHGTCPAFCIMLSHDPNAWKRHIMPVFHPDITLSGHTHGTQFSIFGWTPASIAYEEWGGEYYDSDTNNTDEPHQIRLLSVSTGLGGNFPFRFNMPREIVLITLKRLSNK